MSGSNQIPTTCGGHFEGAVNVQGNLNINVNAQPSTSQASVEQKTPFRCNLPNPRPSFKGRVKILSDILNHFESVERPNCWQRMATIVGIGGIGKTETACTFADKYRDVFPCAAWIDAETKESTLDSFLKLAKELEIVSEDRERANLDLVKEVYKRIAANYVARVLLIFDNAVQLRSDGKDFGILDYLPTKDVGNQRFPFIIITSQTPDWQKGIETFKLDDLSEEESIDFFRSSFNVPSSEPSTLKACDKAFKKLHGLLQGYPLAMNLATSYIHYDSANDSVNWLSDYIKEYIKKFEKEDSRILTQEISKNSTSNYDKTLETVWQLTFQRILEEPNGGNALMLLQALSFFHCPVNLNDLKNVFIECFYCPGTPDWMKFEFLKDAIRLLKRFHIVHCDLSELGYSKQLQVLQSNEENNVEELSRKFKDQVKKSKSFWCELRVHRLIQLVVRLQMECGPVLEDILRFLVFWADFGYVSQLNVPAVEEAITRTKHKTTRALAFIGLLALRNNPSAKQIVRTLSPPAEDPAATIWSVHRLNKDIPTLNAEAVAVLRRFVKLGTSEESLVDKRCFADMALRMLYSQKLFPYVGDDGRRRQGIFLPSLGGMEDIACELLATGCSFTEVCSLPLLCRNVKRGNAGRWTLQLGNEILEAQNHMNLQGWQLPDYNKLSKMLQEYREFLDRGTDKWHQYDEEVRSIFQSEYTRDRFESAVESCGSNQVALKKVFSSILRGIWLATSNKSFNSRTSLQRDFRSIDHILWEFLIHGRDVDILIPLMEAFIEIVAHVDRELQNNLWSGGSNDALIWICSTLMNISVQEDLMGLEILFRHLSRVEVLAEINSCINVVQSFSHWEELKRRHETTYQTFMKNYSESSVPEIRALVKVCGEVQREMSLACKGLGLPVFATLHEYDGSVTRHPGIICDGCSEEGITGRRFRCSTCNDYDLCESCFAERNIHAEHVHVFLVLPIPMASYTLGKNWKRRRVCFNMLGTSKRELLRQSISSEVTCKGCSEGITGLRFICTECQGYDLCQDCHIGHNAHGHHLFVATQNPYVDVLSWVSAMFQAMRVLQTRDRWKLIRMMSGSNQIPTTCGFYVGGNMTVYGPVNIGVNTQPSTSQASIEQKTPFRSNVLIPTPSFKGRADILRDILNHFDVEPVERINCWQRMATIVGIGGVGKSEIACTFARKYRQVFPCAAWIEAETKESTLDSFLKLAKKLEIVSRDTQKADLDVVEQVYEHIDEQYLNRVLLIFDNAVQLHSDGKDFGIFDYLPTQGLANQRFPFIIITSQTPDWHKGIKTFKLEELSEEESIEYFRSSFNVPSSECDEAFKKLHGLLQGYPLAMNLSVSNIDYDAANDTVDWLQDQIEEYIKKFEKEDSRTLTEKISRNSTSKYDKTLATVWQLSFRRMLAMPNGTNALMLLEALSFFHGPVNLDHLKFVFIECHFCSGTPDWMKFECLRDSIRLLQRFHIVHCDFPEIDYSLQLQALQSSEENNVEDLSQMFKEQVKSAKSFCCEFRVYRLIQLVVRLQMECGPVLEDILRFLAFRADTNNVCQLNVPAVEEAIRRTKLTTRALAFIGLLALGNNPSAKRIMRTTSPPSEDPAATIWSVHRLNKDVRTLNAEAVDVCRSFVLLGTSEKSLVDKRCFAKMALQMFNSERLFPYVHDDRTRHLGIFLPSLTGIEDIARELFATGCSFTDVCSLPLLCTNAHRANAARRTLELGNKILEHLKVAHLPDVVAEFSQMLQKYREFLDRDKRKWH